MKKILIITNKDDVTVDFIIKLLQKDGIEYYRFNTEDLFKVVDVRFRIDVDQDILCDKAKKIEVDLSEISAVYFRRPGLPDFQYIADISGTERKYLMRETLSVLDGVYKNLKDCFWINDVFRIREAENKLFQLSMARDAGFDIPDTILSNDADFVKQSMKQIDADEGFVIKAVRSGNVDPETAKTIIFTADIDPEEVTEESIGEFPAYIQRKISKRSDLRSIVVGDKVFTAEIISQNDEDAKTDWRRSPRVLEHRPFLLSQDISNKCIELTRKLGLVYSAIDFALDDSGKPVFLECNPNGQWAWIENRLGFPISNEIEGLLLHG